MLARISDTWQKKESKANQIWVMAFRGWKENLTAGSLRRNKYILCKVLPYFASINWKQWDKVEQNPKQLNRTYFDSEVLVN